MLGERNCGKKIYRSILSPWLNSWYERPRAAATSVMLAAGAVRTARAVGADMAIKVPYPRRFLDHLDRHTAGDDVGAPGGSMFRRESAPASLSSVFTDDESAVGDVKGGGMPGMSLVIESLVVGESCKSVRNTDLGKVHFRKNLRARTNGFGKTFYPADAARCRLNPGTFGSCSLSRANMKLTK
jgi:hypothetical protein